MSVVRGLYRNPDNPRITAVITEVNDLGEDWGARLEIKRETGETVYSTEQIFLAQKWTLIEEHKLDPRAEHLALYLAKLYECDHVSPLARQQAVALLEDTETFLRVLREAMEMDH